MHQGDPKKCIYWVNMAYHGHMEGKFLYLSMLAGYLMNYVCLSVELCKKLCKSWCFSYSVVTILEDLELL